MIEQTRVLQEARTRLVHALREVENGETADASLTLRSILGRLDDALEES
jgi:hypothetical protein